MPPSVIKKILIQNVLKKTLLVLMLIPKLIFAAPIMICPQAATIFLLITLQQQTPEVHPGYQVQLEHPRSPVYAPVQQSQQRRHGRRVRGDSCEQMSVNKKWSDEEYLESQRRMKDLQLQPLSGKIDLGFKPVNIKKPF